MNRMKKLLIVALSLLAGGTMLAGFAACEKQPKTVLSTPKNLRIEDEILYWDEVKGAEKYLVCLNDEEYETEETQFDIFIYTYQPNTYRMSVMALGDTKTTLDSSPSEIVEYTVSMSPILAKKTNDGYEIAAAANYPIKGKLVIPERYNGEPITSIARNGFSDCTELTSVLLPNSITKFGFNAFQGCTHLTRIHLPTILKEIPDSAFNQCSSLWDVNIPESVERIGNFAFLGASSMKEIKLSANVVLGNDCFIGNGLERIEVDEENPLYRSEGNCLIRRADETLLFGCRTSKIPYGVMSIGSVAFSGVELTEIEIPGSVTTIGVRAFQNSTLSRVVFSNGLKTIGNSAFDGTKLSNIEIPNSVTTIGRGAFTHTEITRVVIPESVTELENAFIGCNMTDVSVKAGNPAYYSKGNCVLTREGNVIVMGFLTSEIPAEAEAIGEKAFQNVSFTEFVVPANIKEIGGSAFYGCSNLRSIVLSNGLKKIGYHAFAYCTSLEGIAIPESLTEAKVNAFEHCFATLYFPWAKDAFPSGWEGYRDNDPYHTWLDWNGNMFRSDFYECNLGYDEGQRCYVISTAELRGLLDEKPTVIPDISFIPCRAGYTFAGWATEEGGEVVYSVYSTDGSYVLTDGEELPVSGRATFTPKDDSWINGDTLYAVWIPND